METQLLHRNWINTFNYHVAYSIVGVYMYMTCVLVVTTSWRSLDFKVWTALCHAIAGWMIRTDSHMMDFVAFRKLTAGETRTIVSYNYYGKAKLSKH